MSRFISIILLLSVFFLIGMVFGMNQDTTTKQAPNNFDEQIQENISPAEDVYYDEEEIKEMNQIENMDVMETSAALSVTQKTASIIETGVKGFYEIVVGILYQIAQIGRASCREIGEIKEE